MYARPYLVLSQLYFGSVQSRILTCATPWSSDKRDKKKRFHFHESLHKSLHNSSHSIKKNYYDVLKISSEANKSDVSKYMKFIYYLVCIGYTN